MSGRLTILYGLMGLALYQVSRDIENTRRDSFDIKFTRQGSENAC